MIQVARTVMAMGIAPVAMVRVVVSFVMVMASAAIRAIEVVSVRYATEQESALIATVPDGMGSNV